MTNEQNTNSSTSGYSYRRGTDGCDMVFDIVSNSSGNVVASFYFWDNAPQAEAAAQRLAKAFDTINDVKADLRFHELLAQHRQVAAIWSIEDVQEIREDLDDKQAWEVLKRCRRIHDCNIGFNWEMIECVADDMFPEPDDVAEEEGSVP